MPYNIIMNESEKAKEELMHVGILGMKWGHRKARTNSSGASEGSVKEYNRAVDRMNKIEVKRINAKYKGVDFNKNKKAYNQYMKEQRDTFEKVLAEESRRQPAKKMVKKVSNEKANNVIGKVALGVAAAWLASQAIGIIYVGAKYGH